MSILISGMEMPKDRPQLLWIYPNGKALTVQSDVDPWKDLQAVPVPPHGRLIDADALIEDLERQCKEVFRIDAVSPDDYWITRNEAYNEALWKSWVESFGDYLKAMPTIVKAEE